MTAARPARKEATGSDARFRAFLSSDWARWMSEAPEVATQVGFPGFNDRWSDDSPAGVAARERHLRESVRSLGRFPAGSLSPGERLNRRLYARLLDLAVAGLPFGDDPLPFHFGFPRNLWMPINQMDALHLNVGQLLPLQPRRRREEVAAIIARLRAVPTAVDQTLALLRDGLRRGYSPARVAIRGVPDQVRDLVPEDPTASAVWEPFRNLPASASEEERSRWTGEARDAYVRDVRPAFLRLHRYLVDEYLPGARETIAASDLPQGRAAYAHHVRWVTTTELSPKAIHEIGLREVRRTRTEIESLVRSSGFQGELAEFHRFLRADPRFRCATPEEYIDSFRVIAKRIDPELARHFGRLPRLPYGVEAVPAFQAPSVPAAYYIPGAPSEGRPGIFYANAHDLPARPTWRRESLTLHEAVPGHHLQHALAQEQDDVPEFRRFSGETAFIEGWGLYAEGLGEELGLYRDPYSKFGALDHDIWRSIRLVVDTGMHALGWTREQAIAFFRENTGMSELDITVEVDRYIVWGGQALAYKLGQLTFRELRSFAESALGDRFDARAFHDAVLEEGGLPLGEVEAKIRAWVDRQRRTPPSGRSVRSRGSGTAPPRRVTRRPPAARPSRRTHR